MRKEVIHTYCDRCHKETKIEIVNWTMYRYELCSNCLDMLNNMKEEIEIYEDKIDEVLKKYKFGRYLPKPDELEEIE